MSRVFTQGLGVRLQGGAERVRLNDEQRIKELQDEVRKLSRSRGAAPWELVPGGYRRLTKAATEVGFSNLRGNTDVEYLIRGFVRDDGGVSSAIALRPNGVTSDVRGQILTGNGSSVTAASQSVIIVGRTRANGEVAHFEGTFYARRGSIRVYSGYGSNHDGVTPAIFAEVYTGHWANKTDEVTSLLLVAPPNGFGAESEFFLYRRAR